MLKIWTNKSHAYVNRGSTTVKIVFLQTVWFSSSYKRICFLLISNYLSTRKNKARTKAVKYTFICMSVQTDFYRDWIHDAFKCTLLRMPIIILNNNFSYLFLNNFIDTNILYRLLLLLRQIVIITIIYILLLLFISNFVTFITMRCIVPFTLYCFTFKYKRLVRKYLSLFS